MGKRDVQQTEELERLTTRVLELTTAVDNITTERDTLRSENVRLTIREKDLATRLLAAERELREMRERT